MLKLVGLTSGLILISAIIASVNGECVQCSSATDANCLLGDYILPTNCSTNGVQCFIQIVEGATIRGCATEWSDERVNSCTREEHCTTCINIMGRPGCNSGIFPTTRARCHICSGNGNETMCALAQAQAPQLCPIYANNDRCFILRRGTTFERGCVSSETVCNSAENCLICDGHGCNEFDVNTLVLPEAPGAASLTSATSFVMVVAFLAVAQFKNMF